MDHQPFESWLLQEEPLILEDQYTLKNHLDQCESCRQLSQAYKKVARQFHQPLMVGPAKGFSSRWQKRLEVERARTHRKQSLGLLAFSLVAAFFLMLGLVFYLLPVFQAPKLYILSFIYQFFTFTQVFDILKILYSAIYSSYTAGLSFSPLWIVFLVGLALVLAVLWLISFRKLTQPREAGYALLRNKS